MDSRPVQSRAQRRGRRAGFTLIELMVVVGILGILAALAIPSFIGYVRRSKTSEATQNLNSMFKLAASYMAQEYSDRALGAITGTYCSVGSDALNPTPGPGKQRFSAGANARALGFSIGDEVYFGYGLAGTQRCGWTAADAVYTFFAQGDLDGDNIAAGTDDQRTLRHSSGIYVVNELE